MLLVGVLVDDLEGEHAKGVHVGDLVEVHVGVLEEDHAGVHEDVLAEDLGMEVVFVADLLDIQEEHIHLEDVHVGDLEGVDTPDILHIRVDHLVGVGVYNSHVEADQIREVLHNIPLEKEEHYHKGVVGDKMVEYFVVAGVLQDLLGVPEGDSHGVEAELLHLEEALTLLGEEFVQLWGEVFHW